MYFDSIQQQHILKTNLFVFLKIHFYSPPLGDESENTFRFQIHHPVTQEVMM